MAGEKPAALKEQIPEGQKQKRERSSIEFPYGDIDDAVAVASAIHANAGVGCTTDQLAGYMKQVATSGAFRLRLSTARIFGLIETERGSITLTALGRHIVDPSHEQVARANAFLTVPLYREIFDKYKGHLLPPAAALEREMASLGVSNKQTDKARQAFERSAERAGFFEYGNDRLVMPGGARAPETKPIDPKPIRERGGGGGNGGNDGGNDPLIDALIQKLPKTDKPWSADDRVTWLRMMAMAFQMAYGPEAAIEIKKDEAAS